MKKRNRLEDLGRLSEMLKYISESDLFYLYEGRNKDFIKWFDLLNEEARDEFLNKFIYKIDAVRTMLGECYEVARWGDDVAED